jgi:hypothetical protein
MFWVGFKVMFTVWVGAGFKASFKNASMLSFRVKFRFMLRVQFRVDLGLSSGSGLGLCVMLRDSMDTVMVMFEMMLAFGLRVRYKFMCKVKCSVWV